MNPFAVLGLPPSEGLTTGQVRAAWRTIAAATHPDRDDGGDPERYSRAARAYGQLRTGWGRTEALADLGIRPRPLPDLPPPAGPAWLAARTLRVLAARVRHGRPGHIAARAAAAAAAAWGGTLFAAGTPAEPAAVIAAVTWFLLTSRGDLHPNTRDFRCFGLSGV